MSGANLQHLLAMVLYMAAVVGIGIYFAGRANKDAESYFLGGRSLGPWVTAFSAEASDMSGYLLMGLPGSILAFGFGQMWIGIGLAIGTAANWILCAKRLRTFSKAANDSITLPQYLTNRFAVDSRALQLVCALIFLFAYTIYVASALVAGTSVFTLPGYFPEDRHVRLPAHHRGLHLLRRLRRRVLDGFLPGPSDDGGADAGAYRRLFRPQRAA